MCLRAVTHGFGLIVGRIVTRHRMVQWQVLLHEIVSEDMAMGRHGYGNHDRKAWGRHSEHIFWEDAAMRGSFVYRT